MPLEVQRVMQANRLRGLQMFYQMLSSPESRLSPRAVEDIKDRRSVRSVLAYTEQLNPNMVEAILHARDEHMYEVLNSRVLQTCKGKGPCVLVVGFAHMDGIERRWAAQNGKESVVALTLPQKPIRISPTGTF